MAVEQYTYWGFTINNYDDNDLTLVRNANEKYIRNLVYTLEEGAEGTPHVQGYLRLFRNQTLTFVKRLFPRANFRPLKKDEYELNMRNYVQKDDETTRSPHVQINNQIEVDAISVIMKLLQKYHDEKPLTFAHLLDANSWSGYFDNDDQAYDYLRQQLVYLENDSVAEKPYLAKLFVSPIYDRVLKRFWKSFLRNIHTQSNGVHKEVCSPSDSACVSPIPRSQDDGSGSS